MIQRGLLKLLTLAGLPLLSHCSTTSLVSTLNSADSRQLTANDYESFDGDRFGYRKWLPKKPVNQVVIGVHGISGASSDYRPLAEHLLAHLPDTAIYAAETRGQGNDPIKERRGHIGKRDDWYRDLLTFTALVKKQHPEARVIWCGESMGALIAMHAAAAVAEQAPYDALVLSSPITAIRRDFPGWKVKVAHIMATLFPKIRISLEGLSGQDQVQVTKGSIHQEQAQKNDYHIDRHTLRLLSVLGEMIQESRQIVPQLRVPVLILHAGKDVFSDPKDVRDFAKHITPPGSVTIKFYPESYHLLFYDDESDQVMIDIANWLRSL